MSQSQAKPPADGPSPTVRVMRLYKPSLQATPCMPHLSTDQIVTSKLSPQYYRECSNDYTLSQYILLPDSFGDIYLGEVFAAYISVVNGIDTSYSVTLSARLQTLNATHDLYDSKAVAGDTVGAKVLNTHDSVDMVVQHPLSELGTHTLRVLVSYIDCNTNESKTLRKFYRFNVLNPLKILGTCYDLGDRFMVQSQIVNMTKNHVYIEQVSFPHLSQVPWIVFSQ
jgi:trafficking protein particle complex subunit 13